MMTSDRIKALRHAAGLRQEELAVLLGVGIATIARWENPHGTMPTGLPRNVLEAMDQLDSAGMTLAGLPKLLREAGAIAAVRWILNSAGALLE